MEFSAFDSLFHACLEANGLTHLYKVDIVINLHKLTEHMCSVNSSMNLTRITEPRDIILRHYVDSLTLLPHLPQGAHLLDVGCGAGFPSLPLAIARPDLHITALDSTDKKVQYVNQTAALLGLSDRLHAITSRAEEAAAPGMPLRESFDVVTGRAVAGLPLLTELCVPFLKVDGIFIAMKGGKAAEEMNEATGAYRTLGMTAATLLPCCIHAPEASDAQQDPPEDHALIIARKARKTPEIYPRKYARMLKKPL